MAAPSRQLITGGNPAQAYPVPEFGEDFYLAEDLQVIGHKLIESGRLADFPAEPVPEILFLWKAKGGKHADAKCVKLSGLNYFLAQRADFVIWVAADHARDGDYSRYQVEALVAHELRHVDADFDKDNEFKGFAVKDHDIEAFNGDVTDYGFWDPALKSFAAAVQQRLPLEDFDVDEAARSPGVQKAVGKLVDGIQGKDNGIESVTFSTREGSATIRNEQHQPK